MYMAYTMYTVLFYIASLLSYLVFIDDGRRFSLTVQPYAVTNKCNGLLKKY